MKTKKYVKRVSLALLIVILSFSVLSVIVSVIFYSAAFPRSDSSALEISYTSVDTDNYPYERIRFSSGCNKLTGYLYSAADPRALVVIAAGFRESGASFIREMKTFVDGGYSVLCYDATGVGESEGSGTVGLSQPALDLRAALIYAAGDASLSRLPILLYGHSAGGYAAATCLDLEQVRAAVILSGFESPTSLMRETARGYVGVLADVEYPFIRLVNAMIFSAGADRSASLCIQASSVPVAVYEGAGDEIVPSSVRLSRRLDDSEENVSLTIVEDGKHSDLWLSEDNSIDRGFTEEILSFYKNALDD